MKKLIALLMSVCLMLMLSVPALADGRGDWDKNNRIDTNDVRAMMLHIVNSNSATLTQSLWCDYDYNGTIDTSDAREWLRQTMTALDDSAPVENYATPTGKDYFGEKAINVFGDSVSAGVYSTDPVSEHSYVSYVRKAVSAANGGKFNYGFTCAYTWVGPPQGGSAYDVHKNPTYTSGEWNESSDSSRLTTIGYTAVQPWKLLTFELRDEYKDQYDYFCVYYQSEPGASSFAIADGAGGEVADVKGSKAYIAANNTKSETKRSEFYRLADCPDDLIRVCSGGETTESKTITITGIGYYKKLPSTNPEYVTVNSFTRGGISLCDQADIVLDQVTAADTLIIGLGINDYIWRTTDVKNGKFADRVSYLIKKAKENGTNIIVNDYVWSPVTHYGASSNATYTGYNTELNRETYAIVKSELKRLAKETGGVYIDQQTLLHNTPDTSNPSQSMMQHLLNQNDITHPDDVVYQAMARNVVAALDLEWTESWT